MIQPLSTGKVQSIVRLSDRLKMNGSLNQFAFSNLGNVVFEDGGTTFKMKDLRVYMHSFNFRLLGLTTYTFNGEMHFYYGADEKCMNSGQVHALKNEFMTLLRRVIQPDHELSEVHSVASAVGN
jgi:hypothetical protein